MSRIPDNSMLIECLPDTAGAVHPDKMLIKTIYTMAYIEDLNALFLKLEKSAMQMCTYMGLVNGDNKPFSYHKHYVSEFNEFLVKKGCDAYHRMTCDRAMRQLRDYGFILKLGKGLYVVNPKFFYRGLPALRAELTQQLLTKAMDYEPIDIKVINEITQ